MSYVIGIDGGGTKCKAVILDAQRNIVATYLAGSGNMLASGYDVVKKSIHEIFSNIQRDNYAQEISYVCIGLAGASSKEVRRQVKEIIKETWYHGDIQVTTDAKVALYAGTEGMDGIIHIAGTGSICMGYYHNEEYRVGGYGHILGDEGSAYDIGLKMMKAVLNQHDGRGTQTAITKVLLEDMKITEPYEIVPIVYQNITDKTYIASKAVLIERVMEDAVAIQIMDSAVDSILSNILAVVALSDNHLKDIVLVGSVLEKNSYIRGRVLSGLGDFSVHLSENEPCYGAGLIALMKGCEHNVDVGN